MDNIVAFVGSGLTPEQSKKIAEMLRIHNIATTDNIQLATVIIQPQTNEKNMTIQEMAMAIVEKTIHDTDAIIYKLLEKAPTIIDIPETQPMPRTKSYIQINQKYNRIKQTYRQNFFNRTKHK